jgi:hypothetical protein
VCNVLATFAVKVHCNLATASGSGQQNDFYTLKLHFLKKALIFSMYGEFWANISYYCEYKTSSNLRRIQFLNVGFRKKFDSAHSSNSRRTSTFNGGKCENVHLIFDVIHYIYIYMYIRTGRPGFESRQEQHFSLLHSFQTGSGPHPPSYPMCTGSSFPRVKRAGCEAIHSPPSSVEVKNGGATPPLPHMSSWHSAYLSTGLLPFFVCSYNDRWSSDNTPQNRCLPPLHLRTETDPVS